MGGDPCACGPTGLVIWFTHMKTTVDIADAVFESARRLAAREGTTMRALIEEGLRTLIRQRRATPRTFVLRDASFKGDGLVPGVSLDDWSHVRGLIYEKRGG